MSWTSVPQGAYVLTAVATDNQNATAQDDSNANFSITDTGVTANLVSPNGGENLRFGQQFIITWTIDPAVAYVMHSLMRGVVMRGTAASLNQAGLGYVAGKTGTTSNYRDAWFVGYAPDLLTAVWVGFDDGTPLRMSSGEAAVPIWAAYMTKAPHSHGELRPPGGVSSVEVDVATGRLWQQACGPSVTEVFLSGTEPREPCGGYFDNGQLVAGFEEPAMMSDTTGMEIPVEGAGAHDVEIVKDPDAVEVPETDTASVKADSVPVEPQVPKKAEDSSAKRAEPQRPRERAPQPTPPAVPPVDSSKPTQAPPPPKDSLVLIHA